MGGVYRLPGAAHRVGAEFRTPPAFYAVFRRSAILFRFLAFAFRSVVIF